MKQNTILYVIILGLALALAYAFLNENNGMVLKAAYAETDQNKGQKQKITQKTKTTTDMEQKGSRNSLTANVELTDNEVAHSEQNFKAYTQQDCDECPTMVAIPAGSFEMGDNEGEENEKPVRTVKVDGFHLSETEVTFDQWEACFADGGCSHQPDDNGWGRGNRPVINVSWQDAQEYVRWLKKKTGRRYRLPSEAEWEYAARAGSNKKFAMGDEITCEQAKYGAFSGDCMGDKTTVVVGSYSANNFGLYDMHGNVWEWVEDCYHSDYYSAPNKAYPRKGSDDCKRTLRGGSWFVNSDNLRASYRLWNAAATRIYSLGFRVASD